MPDQAPDTAAATCPGYEWRDNVPWKCQLPPGHEAPCKGNEPSASAATVARIAALAEAVYDRDVLSDESQGDLRDIFMAAQALAEVSPLMAPDTAPVPRSGDTMTAPAYDPKIDEVTREALLRFTPDQHREIEQFATKYGVTKYALIRQLVTEGDPR